jgi:hypothetical protein
MSAVSLRRFVGTALATVALITAACGGDGGSTGPSTPTDVTGSYALTGVRTLGKLHGGGNGLPVTFTDGAGTPLTFKSGELVLNADGSYTLEVEATFGSSNTTMTDEGSYSLAGSSIDFNPTGSHPRMKEGTVKGNKITATTQFGGIPFEIDVAK